MKRANPIIKPDSLKMHETKIIKAEEIDLSSKPSPPKSKNETLSPRHFKFNSKIINDKYILNTDNYTIFAKPKIGGFGLINFVRDKNTSKRYATKTCYRDITVQERKFILRELNILKKVQHSTIIQFEGISYNDFQGNENLTIFMEFMENGALSDLIEKESHSLLPSDFDDTKRQIILAGIARGMMLLHNKKVIHRDLKPENVLLDKNYKPRITDFGLSKFFNPQNSQSQSMSNFGTLPYMAPEIIRSNKFSVKADVYAFGILMYEVVTGNKAFKNLINCKKFNILEFMQNVAGGMRPEFVENQVKKSMRKMIEKCWSTDPNDRPTFSELYSKLSLSGDDFYIDSNNNICESVIDDDDEQDAIDNKYCFDGVDVDELFQYIDEINDDESTINNQEDMQLLKEQIKELKICNKKLEEEICELKKVDLMLKKENVQLKNDTNQLKKECNQFKSEIIDLKKQKSKSEGFQSIDAKKTPKKILDDQNIRKCSQDEIDKFMKIFPKYDKYGDSNFEFDEFCYFMKEILCLHSSFECQMRSCFDALDDDRVHYLKADVIFTFYERYIHKDLKYITKLIFRGTDIKKIRRKIPICELEKYCNEICGISFIEGEFRNKCCLEFGKKKELEYWEFYKIISGETLRKESPDFDPYEGKFPII